MIRDCDVGIESYDDLLLSYSSISSTTDYGVYLRGGTATFTSDTLSTCDQSGIGVSKYASQDSIDVDLTNCYIHDNDVYGFQTVSILRTLDVTGSRIANNYYGMNVLSSRPANVAGSCTIDHNDIGVIVMGPGTIGATISNNTSEGVFVAY
jgi:hypothetical protein